MSSRQYNVCYLFAYLLLLPLLISSCSSVHSAAAAEVSVKVAKEQGSAPTCRYRDTDCTIENQSKDTESKHNNKDAEFPPTCSLWYDGEFVYSGLDRLRNGDTVGEPDVVIPWKNHDKWAWTVWHRYSHFYEGMDGGNNEHIFAPGYTYPMECHQNLANLEATDPAFKTQQLLTSDFHLDSDINYATHQNFPLTASHAIVRGDPVYTNCRAPVLSSKIQLNQLPTYRPGYFKQCTCIDVIQPAPSTIPNAGMGAFSKYAVKKGRPVTFAAAMHMRRSELHNTTSDDHELLLNYVFGHPQTPLLILPAGRGVNYINHASEGFEPNVKLVWSLARGDSIENHFNEDPSHIMFSRSERPSFFVRYEALRDIAPGDEIFLDYGNKWEEAWKVYVEGCGGVVHLARCKSEKPFRHHIGVPDGFFPRQWLVKEVFAGPKYSWDLEDLQPGEIKPVKVRETGAHPMSYGHRAGLPENFSQKMREYADRMGITNIMRKYVIEGQPLPLGGTERHRISGGVSCRLFVLPIR